MTASTLEPASTLNPSGFSVLENLILTSCSAPLPPVPPVLVTVIVPGTLAPPFAVPSSLNSPLVCNPIVPPLVADATCICLISSL